YYFYFPPENKVIVARYGNFLERDLISQKFGGRDNDLEDDHMNTLPSENTNKIPADPESLGSPPELIPIRRSEKTTRAPNHLCLNIEVKDNEVGDLGEPANYKAAMLDHDKDLGEAAYILGIKIYRDRSRRRLEEQKQTTIAMHSAQAEYVAASEAAMEAVWIRKFVGDLGVMPFETGEIKLIKVHTYDNLADPFTKALPRGMVIDHAKGIGLQLASIFIQIYD
nr:retrovirus-related Pol polyprotein from transposon TNT 1-94 [Tanacetum cinerariifolium]